VSTTFTRAMCRAMLEALEWAAPQILVTTTVGEYEGWRWLEAVVRTGARASYQESTQVAAPSPAHARMVLLTARWAIHEGSQPAKRYTRPHALLRRAREVCSEAGVSAVDLLADLGRTLT